MMVSIDKTRRQLATTLRSPMIRQSLWTIVDVALYPVVMVVSIPLFMTRLGDEAYGIWMLVNTLIASLSLVNVGFGEATVRGVATHRAHGDEAGAGAVVSATLSAYAVIGLGVWLAATGLSIWLEGQGWQGSLPGRADLRISPENLAVAHVAFRLGAATFALRLIEQILLSALRGYERYDRASQISIVSKTAVLGLNIGMVWAGAGLEQVFINTALLTLLSVLAEGWLVYRLLPAGTLRLTLTGSGKLGEIAPFGFWMWLQSVMAILGGQLDKYLISSLAGVAVLGYYQNAALVGERGLSVLASGAAFLFPVISKRSAEGGRLDKMYGKLQFVMATVAIVSLGGFMLAAPALLSLIWGQKFLPTAPYLPAFGAYIAGLALTVIPYYLLTGTGRARLGTLLRLVTLACQLGAIPLSYHLGGRAAIPYGVCVGMFAASMVHNYLICRQIFPDRAAVGFALSQGVLPWLFLGVIWSWHQDQTMLVAVGWVAIALVWAWVYYRPVAHLWR